ncbi:CHAT domain-containing protein [Kitasatospora aureofaciens]|uniref:CHAT domain-containing protein n=1 Tax=Kitasatospora aureofaciens TaxID=1894 RepID=UPI0037C5D271
MNACRTAADPVDRLGGLAHAFLDQKTEAVVSMQADIDSRASVVFAGALYRSVAKGLSVDRAVHAARRKLRNDYAQQGYWALPVLATHCDPESVLAIRSVPTEQSFARLCKQPPYSGLELFVDRADERRKVWRALDPADPADDRPLVVIDGYSKVQSRYTGKTWFTLCCLLSCFVHGHRITYVNLSSRLPGGDGGEPGNTNKDWLDLLRAVRAACVDDSQPEPLPAEAFSGFNAELNALVEGAVAVTAEAGDAAAAGPVVDQGKAFNEQVGQADKRRERIFRAFLEALHAASPDRVHVLALDHAEVLLPVPCREIVYPQLIAPIARGQESPLRLLLVATREWMTTRVALPPEHHGQWEPLLTLGDFPPSEYLRLADEYCERAGLDFAKAAVRNAFEGYGEFVSEQGGVEVDFLRKVRKTLAPAPGEAP